MEDAAKRFVRRVLVIHALLLAAVVVVVVIAFREIYTATRLEALDQVRQRHELLAAQTARGIESFYRSILDHLLMLQPDHWINGQMPEDLQQRLAAALLEMQLQGRVAQLFVYQPQDQTATPLGPTQAQEIGRIVEEFADWFSTLREPASSGFVSWQQPPATLVALPLSREPQRLLVAAVPVGPIEQRFLDPLNKQQTIWAVLLDESGAAMASAGREDFPGLAQLNQTLPHPVDRDLPAGVRATRIYDGGIPAPDGRRLPPQMVTAEPLEVLDRRWTLVLAADLDEVQTVLTGVMGQSLLWAAFVIASVMAILISTAVKLIRVRMRLERVQHEVLTREMDHARRIQLAWLPQPQATVKGLEIAAFNCPASHISGDFYNWLTLPDGRAAVVIGDVTGHGMSAAFLMATTQMLTRSILLRLSDPGQCLRELNRELCVQMFSGQFVTLLIMVIDPESGELEAATAGHFPPLISQQNGSRPLDLPPQLVLGIDPEVQYRTHHFRIEQGARLLLYTDGVLDVQAPDGRRYDLELLRQSLASEPGAQGMIDAVLASVDAFRGEREPADDLTLVAVQLQPAAARAPTPRTLATV